MLNKVSNFYNNYHKKNNYYHGVIAKNNFTYFYITQLLQKDYILKAKLFLDIGCGVGTLAIYLASLGKKVVGIDISDRAIDIAKKAIPRELKNNLSFLQSDISKFKNKNTNKFDVVICTEVIEHIENDVKFVNDLYSVIRPGGYLVLTTPTPENFLYRIGFYNTFDKEVGHLRRYSKNDLENLLRENGFRIIYFRQTESILRSLLFTTKMGFFIKFIRGPLVPIFHKFDEFLGLFFGFTDNQVIATKQS